MADWRTSIASRIHAMVGSKELDLARAPGDPGLFAPDSAAWTVHGDFAAMMIGGLSSLLVQMLHPAALAGIWDHSNFRRDPDGRLKRTAQFIALTTYGPTDAAERGIARVRAIHARVGGTLPDGTPYRADDPDLLLWVHAAEVDAFLRSHLRHRDPGFPTVRQDAYLDEMADLAVRLGVDPAKVPRTRAELSAYFADVRPALRCDARTCEVAGLLLRRPTASLAMAPVAPLLRGAAVELMPAWARDLHGLRLHPGEAAAVRAATPGLNRMLRWALAG